VRAIGSNLGNSPVLGGLCAMNLLAGELNRPEFRFLDRRGTLRTSTSPNSAVTLITSLNPVMFMCVSVLIFKFPRHANIDLRLVL
jgi:hypothetical protein